MAFAIGAVCVVVGIVSSYFHHTAIGLPATALGCVWLLRVWWRLRNGKPRCRVIVIAGDGPEATIVSGLLSLAESRAIRECKLAVLREPTMADAISRCGQELCDEVIVTGSPDVADLRATDRWGRPVLIVSGREVVSRLLRRVPLDVAASEPRLLSPGTASPRFRCHAAFKRAGDIAFATCAGFLLAPIALVIAGALWLGRQSPVLSQEERVGAGGRVFRMYFFGSSRLVQPAESDAPEDFHQQPTRLARALQRLHLDLIPALWNVVRGDLSVIGPRPEHPAVVEMRQRDMPLYATRHRVRPGLASWAQVCFRYTDAPRDTRLALEYDLYYVAYGSLRLDVQILAKALWLWLGDAGVYLAALGRARAQQAFRRLAAVRRVTFARSGVSSLALPRLPDAARTGDLRATLVVGAGDGGRLLVRELRRNVSWGYWPVAFVDDDPEKLGTRVAGLPVLGTTSDLPVVVRREQVHAVVIAIPSAPQVTIQRIAELARQTPAQVLTMPHIGALLRGEARDFALEQVAVTDVLGRPIVEPDVERCRLFVAGRRVLVTGAAGSIGRELVRQLAQLEPALIVGLDINESDLFDLQQEISRLPTAISFEPVVASITNRLRLEAIFAGMRPDIVFHAAAYKHVPMMEEHPQEAVDVNIVGTYESAQVAAATGVERFVLVSTDKAVRPRSVMGATKRLAEHAVRAVSAQTGLSVCAVRFGNVLGSRGSVVPLFEKQIAAGGPVTVTHPEVRRYFMTIPEAAGLIIQAGAFGDRDVIYMLDMGEEILIRDLAERMIRLRGLRVGEDIEIVYTGLRPGEKLREELAYDFEQALPTPHPKIRILAEAAVTSVFPHAFGHIIEGLAEISRCGTAREVRRAVMRAVAELDGSSGDAHEPSAAAAQKEAVNVR